MLYTDGHTIIYRIDGQEVFSVFVRLFSLPLYNDEGRVYGEMTWIDGLRIGGWG